MAPSSPSARVRERLDHPVLDGDAHFLENFPAFFAFLEQRGRGELAQHFAPFSASPMGRGPAWHEADQPTREHHRRVRPPWWVATGHTRDFATAVLPPLYYERLDDIGVDFAVLYATGGLGLLHMDGDRRPELCRLFNEWNAEQFGPYADRMTPAALVPMNTPDEAIEGLEHAQSLGLKVALVPSYVARAVPALEERAPELAPATWIDTYGIDSIHDYDPFWRRVVELGFPLACHSNAMGFTDRASISNYMYNHIGHFAAAGEALAKSLFFGGVTFRFPELRVALLEGGVAHGVRLYHDLIHRWKKRGGKNVAWLAPAGLDRAELGRLFGEYGDGISDE
jgi:predicted TIM-barrel fold metal-dependent hydrolase